MTQWLSFYDELTGTFMPPSSQPRSTFIFRPRLRQPEPEGLYLGRITWRTDASPPTLRKTCAPRHHLALATHGERYGSDEESGSASQIAPPCGDLESPLDHKLTSTFTPPGGGMVCMEPRWGRRVMSRDIGMTSNPR
jgi:hypothetical protein